MAALRTHKDKKELKIKEQKQKDELKDEFSFVITMSPDSCPDPRTYIRIQNQRVILDWSRLNKFFLE